MGFGPCHSQSQQDIAFYAVRLAQIVVKNETPFAGEELLHRRGPTAITCPGTLPCSPGFNF
jgi:hypothetical protein